MEKADLRNRRLLFTLSLGESGINLNWYAMMKYLRLNRDALEGSVGGVILDGNSELFTKSTGEVCHDGKQSGLLFSGKASCGGNKDA